MTLFFFTHAVFDLIIRCAYIVYTAALDNLGNIYIYMIKKTAVIESFMYCCKSVPALTLLIERSYVCGYTKDEYGYKYNKFSFYGTRWCRNELYDIVCS